MIQAKRDYLASLQSSLNGDEHGNGECIPSEWYTVKFTKSQGAGGQHVNKTSSQAVVRLYLEKAASTRVFASRKMPAIPKVLCNHIWQQSAQYNVAGLALQLSASDTRSSHQNRQIALDRLYEHIVKVVKAGIPGETSEQQKRRVQALIERQKAKDRLAKQKRSQLKATRRVSKLDF